MDGIKHRHTHRHTHKQTQIHTTLRQQQQIIRESKSKLKQPQNMFYKKVDLKNFAIFTGKHLCWGLSLITLQA